MLNLDDITRIKEIADIIKGSKIDYNGNADQVENSSLEFGPELASELVGSCTTEEELDEITNEESQKEEPKKEEPKKEEPQEEELTSEQNIILYSLALKRFVIEQHSELSPEDIQEYAKKFGGKQKTRMRAAMNSARFKEVYESCYAKNIQEVGADGIFPIPKPKEDCQLSFLQFLNVFYDSFVKSHKHFKNQMIKIARTYYKQEKAQKIKYQMDDVLGFLKHYVDNPDIFNEDNLTDTLNEAGSKYGANFMADMHPVLYIFSDLLSRKMEGLFFKQIDVLEDWLNIKYDDRDKSGKIEKLFVKMFYSKTPIGAKKAEIMANEYWTTLSSLLEAEKKNKEDVRRQLIEENAKIKEARKKDDMKLRARKLLQKK